MSAEERYRFIRSEMVRNGVTNISVCQAAKVSKQRLHDVLIGKAKGYRIRQITAQMCNRSVEYFWPDTPEQFRHAA